MDANLGGDDSHKLHDIREQILNYNDNYKNDNNSNNSDKSDNDSDNNSSDSNSDTNNSDTEDEMAPISSLELFNAVNQQFKKTYAGDPLALNTFLDGVDIVAKFATTDELRKDLFDYLRAKLEGRAREFITDNIVTVNDLKRALVDNIKPENSKVIEGRIATLRYSFSKQEEFSARAEELADSLRRTLIIEGMTAAKATEISIDKTIELCRRSTTSDVVKSVLGAGTFKSPKEVVAKLITENDTQVKEQRIMRCQQFERDQRNKNGRGKYGKGKGGKGGNGGNNNGYNNNGGGRGRNNGQNGNGKYNNGNRGGGNYRGRSGQGGGRRSNNYNQNYGQQNNQGGNGNWRAPSGQNDGYVRLAQSGNPPIPQQNFMGAQYPQNL